MCHHSKQRVSIFLLLLVALFCANCFARTDHNHSHSSRQDEVDYGVVKDDNDNGDDDKKKRDDPVESAFKRMAHYCFEKVDCVECANSFDTSAREVEVKVFASMNHTRPDVENAVSNGTEVMRDQVLRRCEEMRSLEKTMEDVLRRVVFTNSSGTTENEGVFLTTLYTIYKSSLSAEVFLAGRGDESSKKMDKTAAAGGAGNGDWSSNVPKDVRHYLGGQGGAASGNQGFDWQKYVPNNSNSEQPAQRYGPPSGHASRKLSASHEKQHDDDKADREEAKRAAASLEKKVKELQEKYEELEKLEAKEVERLSKIADDLKSKYDRMMGRAAQKVSRDVVEAQKELERKIGQLDNPDASPLILEAVNAAGQRVLAQPLAFHVAVKNGKVHRLREIAGVSHKKHEKREVKTTDEPEEAEVSHSVNTKISRFWSSMTGGFCDNVPAMISDSFEGMFDAFNFERFLNSQLAFGVNNPVHSFFDEVTSSGFGIPGFAAGSTGGMNFPGLSGTSSGSGMHIPGQGIFSNGNFKNLPGMPGTYPGSGIGTNITTADQIPFAGSGSSSDGMMSNFKNLPGMPGTYPGSGVGTGVNSVDDIPFFGSGVNSVMGEQQKSGNGDDQKISKDHYNGEKSTQTDDNSMASSGIPFFGSGSMDRFKNLPGMPGTYPGSGVGSGVQSAHDIPFFGGAFSPDTTGTPEEEQKVKSSHGDGYHRVLKSDDGKGLRANEEKPAMDQGYVMSPNDEMQKAREYSNAAMQQAKRFFHQLGNGGTVPSGGMMPSSEKNGGSKDGNGMMGPLTPQNAMNSTEEYRQAAMKAVHHYDPMVDMKQMPGMPPMPNHDSGYPMMPGMPGGAFPMPPHMMQHDKKHGGSMPMTKDGQMMPPTLGDMKHNGVPMPGMEGKKNNGLTFDPDAAMKEAERYRDAAMDKAKQFGINGAMPSLTPSMGSIGPALPMDSKAIPTSPDEAMKTVQDFGVEQARKFFPNMPGLSQVDEKDAKHSGRTTDMGLSARLPVVGDYPLYSNPSETMDTANSMARQAMNGEFGGFGPAAVPGSVMQKFCEEAHGAGVFGGSKASVDHVMYDLKSGSGVAAVTFGKHNGHSKSRKLEAVSSDEESTPAPSFSDRVHEFEQSEHEKVKSAIDKALEALRRIRQKMQNAENAQNTENTKNTENTRNSKNSPQALLESDDAKRDDVDDPIASLTREAEKRLDAAKKSVQSVIDSASQGAQKVVDNSDATMKDIAHRAQHIVQSASNAARQVVDQHVNSLHHGVNDTIRKVDSTVDNTADAARNGVITVQGKAQDVRSKAEAKAEEVLDKIRKEDEKQKMEYNKEHVRESRDRHFQEKAEEFHKEGGHGHQKKVLSYFKMEPSSGKLSKIVNFIAVDHPEGDLLELLNCSESFVDGEPISLFWVAAPVILVLIIAVAVRVYRWEMQKRGIDARLLAVDTEQMYHLPATDNSCLLQGEHEGLHGGRLDGIEGYRRMD